MARPEVQPVVPATQSQCASGGEGSGQPRPAWWRGVLPTGERKSRVPFESGVYMDGWMEGCGSVALTAALDPTARALHPGQRGGDGPLSVR